MTRQQRRMAFLGTNFLMASAIVLAISASARTAVAEGKEIKVMSYNILSNRPWTGKSTEYAEWADRRRIVFDVIAAQSPDLVGLQEVDRTQFQDLKYHFVDYEVCYARAHQGTDTGNAIMYLKERFSSFGCDSLLFDLLIEKPTCADGTERQTRNRMWALLHDRQDPDNIVLFINTHYPHKAVCRSRRLAASGELRDQVSDLSGLAPVILVGDLNSMHDPVNPPDWWADHLHDDVPLNQDIELTMLTDPSEGLFTDMFWPTLSENDVSSLGNVASTPRGSRIDHIFATAGVTASTAFITGDHETKYDDVLAFPVNGAMILLSETGETYPSDHFAIGATLVLPN